MELFEYHPTTKSGEPFYLMPLGDIQYTGRDEDLAGDLLSARVELAVKLNAKLIGLGDYIDYASPSNRQRIRSSGLYDTALQVQEDAAYLLVDKLYTKYLAPTKGMWLGLLEGHHFYELSNGTTTDQYLAGKLGAKFLGSTAYIGLHFRLRGTSEGSTIGTVNIWASHGVGSSKGAAGQLRKLEDVAGAFEADIYLMGHYSKAPAAPIERLYPYWFRTGATPILLHKTKLLVGTGSFSKAYVQGSRAGLVPRGGYVEQALMTPAVLTSPLIRIVPRRRHMRIDGQKIEFFEAQLSVELEC
jgi:hypothetical protein